MFKENKLDILIPVFNEDETIIKTIKNILSEVKCDYKIFICYDYDEDPTLKIIKDNFPPKLELYLLKNLLVAEIKQAILLFISSAPLPNNLPSAIVAEKGGYFHDSSLPGGTTSV